MSSKHFSILLQVYERTTYMYTTHTHTYMYDEGHVMYVHCATVALSQSIPRE